MDDPALDWSGTAYVDSNHGTEPLEDGFVEWSWSRAHRADDTIVLYDALTRDGSHRSLALRFTPENGVEAVPPPPAAKLPATGWLLRRATRADDPGEVRVEATLEDTPFYARSLLRGQILGQEALAMHESLSLNRLKSPIVRAMLPFRMPRRIW